jgi:protein-tyrosine phosphatase
VTVSIPNCRPLTTKPNAAGRPPRENLIFRSASPAAVGEAVGEWTEARGIRHIYDFRSAFEIHQEGTVQLPEVTITHIDVLVGVGADGREFARVLDDPEGMMLRLYRKVFPSRAEFGLLVRGVLAQSTPPFLFHCTAGKDRTGIAAAILMHLLGYGLDEIYQEYMTLDPGVVEDTTREMKALAARTGRTLNADALAALTTVRSGFLDAFHDGVAERYGSIHRYLREFLGVSEDEIRTLRDRYLMR